jgi:hypothetical protein
MTEKAAFDIRVWVEADTEHDVWKKIYRQLEWAQDDAQDGVRVRYVQLRPASRSKRFKPTMEPKWRSGLGERGA